MIDFILCSSGQIQDLGQQTLNDFNACMFYQNDSILSDDLIFKLLSICMMIVDRIQRTRSRTVKRKLFLCILCLTITEYL